MNRLGLKVLSSVLASVAAASLAACGGGSHSAPPVPAATKAPAYTGPLASATFTITIPAPATASAKRKPQYISAATKSVRVNMTATTNPTYPGTINVLTPVTNGTGNAPGSPCTGSGPWTCTVTMQVPPGSDTFTFTTYDDSAGNGNILSQQIKQLAIVVGKANNQGTDPNFAIIFDANPNVINVLGSQPCQAGTVINTTYGSVGTSQVTLNINITDLAGKTIAEPGYPLLSAFDSTSGTYKTSGTITGSTDHADFTINQSTKTITLTPSSSNVAGAVVKINAVPKTTTDGLPQGGVFKQFTFSTGPAPGAGFLAAVEQTGSVPPLTGQIDLFTVDLSIDQFNNYTVTGGGHTLANTASSSEPGKFDIDNPVGLAFDTNGDLLIANGGTTTSGDSGNLACVPAGSIATGANNATTNSSNVDLGYPRNPIAYLTDGGVALANNPTNAPVQVDGFTLSGNYVQSSSRSLTASGYGAFGVVSLPSLTSGSYAVALTNGTLNAPHNGAGTPLNKVSVVRGDGSGSYDITDPTIDIPYSVAWDSHNSQLAIASNSSWHPVVNFYTITSSSATRLPLEMVTTGPLYYLNYYLLVASSDTLDTSNDGKIAVVGATSNGMAQVQIIDNTTSRNITGTIYFNTMNGPGCTNGFIYPASVVTSMTWLSNTKLLIALQSSSTAKQGLYIFDTSQSQTNAGYDDQKCTAAVSGPKQTRFLQLNNRPLGTAYKQH